MSTPVLEARGLSKRYPGVVALDGLDFALDAGEIVGLVGKNGAGKSTMIKVLAGVVSPDAGEVLVDGVPAGIHTPHDAAAAGLAFVHQELSDAPNLSVAENIFLGLGYPRRGPLVRWSRLMRDAATVLERLQTTISPRAIVGTLSPVEQRLVMIARALAQRARVLVLDEPSASLTDEEIEHLHQVVRRLAADGVAIVYVTHRLREVRELTHTVVVMRDGRLVTRRPTSELGHEDLVRLISGDAAVSGATALRRRAGAEPGEELLRATSLSDGGLLDDASVVVRAGEVVGLAGLLGSGRSELARCLSGATRPARGELYVRRQTCAFRSPAQAIGAGVVRLPEDRRHEGNILSFSVRANITLPSLAQHRRRRFVPWPSRRSEAATAQNAIEQLAIKTPSADAHVEALSGGNQQKVAFAKWLQREPDVFILDEPTQGIDVGAKQELFALAADLAGQGKGVLLFSSDFSELVSNCERVFVLREGRTVAELTASEISEDAILAACYA